MQLDQILSEGNMSIDDAAKKSEELNVSLSNLRSSVMELQKQVGVFLFYER